MDTVLTIVVMVALIAGGVFWLVRQRTATRARELDDARSEARRWVERLGGQILILEGTNDASKQALADASERHNAAGPRSWTRLSSPAQARQVTESAYEGLYYVRAARTAMGLDPGPELPPLPGQQRAGTVSEDREVEVEGQAYSASPEPVAAQPALLPRGHGRRPAGAAGLVLRAVVAPRPGRRRLGGRVGAAVQLAVRRDVRRGLRRRFRRRRRPRTATRACRRRTPGATGGDVGGDDGGGDGGGDFGAATSAAGATSSDPPTRSDLSGLSARLSDRPGGTFPGRSARSGARVLRSVPTGAPTAPSSAALPAAPA